MYRYWLPIACLLLGLCVGATFRDTAFAQEKAGEEQVAKWEYKVEWIFWNGGDRVSKPEVQLNKIAAEGWEYVNAPGGGSRVVFKRPKRE